MRSSRIVKETLRLNGKCDGAWLVIAAHPVFNIGKWTARLENGRGSVTIASEFDVKDTLRVAEWWLAGKNRSDIEAALAEVQR